jgi:hypothetical protein
MKKLKLNYIQQGDVTLEKISILPSGEKKVLAKKRCVLAEGEVTGHAHVIEDDEAELIQIGEKMLLSLGRKTTLFHEEHGPIELESGFYEVDKINEYDYFSQMVRKVVD